MAALARLRGPALMDEPQVKLEITMIIKIADIASPIGAIRLAANDTGLVALDYLDRWDEIRERLERRFGKIGFQKADDPHGAITRINRYLKGDLSALEDIPVDTGGTQFQQQVWQALRAIPPGRTTSYMDLARSIGRPKATRAVGAANGRNPVSIIIPCHRVIGTDGQLCGYAGGLERKRWLLSHEGAGPQFELFASSHKQ